MGHRFRLDQSRKPPAPNFSPGKIFGTLRLELFEISRRYVRCRPTPPCITTPRDGYLNPKNTVVLRSVNSQAPASADWLETTGTVREGSPRIPPLWWGCCR